MIDWLLLHLPSWFPIGVICLGIVLFITESFLDSVIPLLYRIPIKILSIIAFCGGFYLEGKDSVLIPEQKTIEKIVEKTVVQQQVVTNTVVKYIHDKQKVTEDNHDKNEAQIDTKDDHMCVIPNKFVRLHDASAQDTVSNPSPGTDDSASQITLSTVESTMLDNYEQYNKVAEQLTTLQLWIKEQKELADK